jgi:Amidohydrolase family
MSRHLAVIGLCLAAAFCAARNDAAKTDAIAISHVTVIDGTGAAARTDQTVVVKDGRITYAGPSAGAPAPQAVRIVDARGLYLIPGLWDMHVHVWDPDLAFPLFLANGVTGVRNMGGHPAELKRWREELAQGKRIGPQLVACGPVVDGRPAIHPDHSIVVENEEQARAAVDKLKSEPWDFVKVYDNVPREAYFAIAAEAKKDGIPFVGHVPLSVTALEASDAGQRSIEHLDGLSYVISPLGEGFRRARLERIGRAPEPGEMMKLPMRIANEINQLAESYDEARAASLFARLARNGTWQVPTLSVAHAFGSIGDAGMYGDARLKYVDAAMRDSWEHNPIVHIEIPEYVAARKGAFQEALRITRGAHSAGVRFLAGTDSGGVPYMYYGFSLHDELALLVVAGFTPMQALQAATSDAAEFLGLADSGTIETGKSARMVLLTADPLADILNARRIDAVIVGDRVYDRRELDSLLATAEKQAK